MSGCTWKMVLLGRAWVRVSASADHHGLQRAACVGNMPGIARIAHAEACLRAPRFCILVSPCSTWYINRYYLSASPEGVKPSGLPALLDLRPKVRQVGAAASEVADSRVYLSGRVICRVVDHILGLLVRFLDFFDLG